MTDRLEQLRQLAAADPEDALTHFLLGREFATQGLDEEAAGEFRHVLRLQPRYTAAYRQLGNSLERLSRFEEATGIYRSGVEIAAQTGDLQAGKEMTAFLKRLERKSGDQG